MADAVVDMANPGGPGPARPGQNIWTRQQERARRGIIGILRGNLLSPRKQEIYYYSLFVLCFSIAWFIDRPGQKSFFLSDRVGRRFLQPAFRTNYDADLGGERSVAWADVSSLEELWGWMEGPLLSAAYDEDTPGSGVGNVLGYSGICNGIRIRQVRVKPQPCQSMPAWAEDAITKRGGFQGECYPESQPHTEDNAAFGPASVFEWSEGNAWAATVGTNFGRYGRGGYIFDLPSFNKTLALELVQYHHLRDFFDVQTRAVFIEATFYHPSMERFVTMRLLAEAPEMGGVETSSMFISTSVKMYSGPFGFIQLVLEGVYVLQICGYCFWEVMLVRKLGVDYVKRFWGLAMLTKGVLMLCLIGFRVTMFQTLERQRAEWESDDWSPDTYIDMQHIPTLMGLDENVLAVMSILIYARLFKLLAESKSIAHLYKVIYKAMAEMIPFFILFVIVYIGFSLAFYSCFGLRVYEYRNLENTFRSNVALLAGDADWYSQLATANPNMAPFLYYSFILAEYVLLLNMFAAIIVQNMAIVKAAQEKDTDVVFLEALNKGLAHFKPAPKKTKKNKVKDAYSSERAKDSLSSKTAGASVSNLFGRTPSGGSVGGGGGGATARSGLSTGSVGDQNPSGGETNRSNKSGGWASIRSMVSGRKSKAGSEAGSNAGDDFDAPMTSRSGRSRLSRGGGMGAGIDSAGLADLEEQVGEIKRHVLVVDDVKMQLMAVSDRLNALTEYLVSDSSASRSMRQFQTLNRKLDMLAEALVAVEVQARMQAYVNICTDIGIDTDVGIAEHMYANMHVHVSLLQMCRFRTGCAPSATRP